MAQVWLKRTHNYHGRLHLEKMDLEKVRRRKVSAKKTQTSGVSGFWCLSSSATFLALAPKIASSAPLCATFSVNCKPAPGSISHVPHLTRVKQVTWDPCLGAAVLELRQPIHADSAGFHRPGCQPLIQDRPGALQTILLSPHSRAPYSSLPSAFRPVLIACSPAPQHFFLYLLLSSHLPSAPIALHIAAAIILSIVVAVAIRDCSLLSVTLSRLLYL